VARKLLHANKIGAFTCADHPQPQNNRLYKVFHQFPFPCLIPLYPEVLGKSHMKLASKMKPIVAYPQRDGGVQLPSAIASIAHYDQHCSSRGINPKVVIDVVRWVNM